MGKELSINRMFMKIAIVLCFLSVLTASGQKEKKPYIIPDDINLIFKASCMPCHGEGGGRYPNTKLNFSKWVGYGPSKEAEKASMICSSLRKGSMPPKSAIEKKSVIVPTKEQIDLICQWAESLKQNEKKQK
jgi:hypothetical protein